ncbi:MAG: B12-binding domain-containing radical SAM protein [Syntrophales bacterium]|nr:B12-binding domain-containing radical SAM protein [Syntrophales bacterium]
MSDFFSWKGKVPFILLVNPRFNGLSEVSPLALESLATPVLEDGFDVHILDMDVGEKEERYEILDCYLETKRPLILGVTCMSNTVGEALKICERAKNRNSDVLTVLGGIHATVLYDEILRDYEVVDVVCRGEGEETFQELVQDIYCGHPPEDVPGLSYRRGKEVIHNPNRPLVRDLGSYPFPAFHLSDSRYYKVRSISSSRGCPNRCTFCSIRRLYGSKVRFEPLEKVLEEIGMLRGMGARRILFTDDNFTSFPERVREICRAITRNFLNQDVEFYAQGRIDDVCRQPLMASWMSEAGFKGLYIGAESGSEEILSLYGKDLQVENIIKGVSYCVEQNLTPVVSFILFGPWDTVDTIRETIRLGCAIFKMGAEIAYTESLIPFPGTPIQETLIRDGKWHEKEWVYYFSSYRELDIDRMYKIFDLARAMVRVTHGADPYFTLRKTFYEFSMLDYLLEGKIPPDYRDWRDNKFYRGNAAMEEAVNMIETALAEIF